MRRGFFSLAPVVEQVILGKGHSNPKYTSKNFSSTQVTASATFWPTVSREMPLYELKRLHTNERFLDKKMRFASKDRLREDGVLSNIYPLHLEPGKELYIYKVNATRQILTSPIATRAEPAQTPARRRQSTTSTKRKGVHAETATPLVKRVDPTRALQAVHRYLQQHFPDAPPHVSVRDTLYAVGPLPAAALSLPREAMDYGWEMCDIRFNGRLPMARLSAMELQELSNRIMPWALRRQGGGKEGFAVAREATGKLTCTHESLKVGGQRVFHGTIVRTIFVDASGAIPEEMNASGCGNIDGTSTSGQFGAGWGEKTDTFTVPQTHVLTTLADGVHATPLRFLVREKLRDFEYKKVAMQSYRVEDASGVIAASLQKATKETALTPGLMYEATNYRVRVLKSRGDLRVLELTVGETSMSCVSANAPLKDTASAPQHGEAEGTTTTESKKPGKRAKKRGKAVPVEEKEEEEEKKKQTEPTQTPQSVEQEQLPGTLALKMDTKCILAAELSLWDEVKQHFGSGPYDKAAEEAIARSVQGTPVVSSHLLRHGIIRLVRFNITPSAALSLDPKLQRHAGELEPGQPYAVLRDHAVLPLQALHCCYDPRVRVWNDTGVSACSFLPSPRLALLARFHAALRAGLLAWGLALAPRALSSRALSILPPPRKTGFSPRRVPSMGRHAPPPPFPTRVAVVAIAAQSAEADERSRLAQTAQSLAASLEAAQSVTVEDEPAAVAFLAQQFASERNAAAILVTPHRDTRRARWVRAECLTRGILPLFLPPIAAPSRRRLGENARVRLRACFETDPTRGIDVAKEVPAVSGRRVLLVGVDACHTTTFSTGSVVGVLLSPERNHVLPHFWKHEARGQEVAFVAEYFGRLLTHAAALYDGLDEVVVFQDGDVYSEAAQMHSHVPDGCGFTFMCLHKRSNVRFVQRHAEGGRANNVGKGAVVQALTPVQIGGGCVAPSFYLQNHDCNMSTARTVEYTVHCASPSLDVADVQQLSFVLSHVMATQATKLPMPARCAHRLASVAERLLDAAPPLTCDMIPAPLNERLWFF